MLELKQIKKDYPAGGETVHALRGIDLQFRESEFVSILGPSGCGKTTLLNIIGGLDRYSSGDLIINGKHTGDFKNRDWDTYRNHSIGFVFQSYNLIPHQSVLQNVELALTLSGVSKKERRKRAIEALKMVGLESQIRKRPGEMSGGQMQRVAIARAIVNNPDIILADEPTGALDTETSVQVMDILQEIAKDRLVIMVTHNPELAEKYSTRIIRMLDGRITDDSMPLTEVEAADESKKGELKAAGEKKKKMPSMSLATSFGLSLKNLFTKKGRTVLTSFAGSIGIIGIALIYAVSNGTTNYINAVQEDTLSSYPLTLESQHMDVGSLLKTFLGSAQSGEEHDRDAVYQKAMLYKMVNALNSVDTNENDLKSFKAFIVKELEDQSSKLSTAVTGVQYTYDTDLLIYTESVDGNIICSDTQKLLSELLREYYGVPAAGGMSGMSGMSSSMGFSMGGSMSGRLWQEILPGKDGSVINPILYNQYDMIYGRWPSSYDEIILVVDEKNEIADMTLYALGLKSKEEIDAIAKSVFDKSQAELKSQSWSFEEICNMTFKTILQSACYSLDEASGTYKDLRDSEAGLKYLYDNGLSLHVTGIIRPKAGAASTMLSGNIGYTYKLTEYIVSEAEKNPVAVLQKENKKTDIFTGLPFREFSGQMTDSEKKSEFINYVSTLSTAGKAMTYARIMSLAPAEYVETALAAALEGKTRGEQEQVAIQAIAAQTGMSGDLVSGYIASMSDEEVADIYANMVQQQIKMQYAQNAMQSLAGMDEDQLAAALSAAMAQYTDEQFAMYHDEILEFSDSTYEENLKKLGITDLDDPSSINIYASSFENKDVIEDIIAEYNSGAEELSKIEYTDYVGIMMSSVTTIINAISYVLIAFVSVSLIVSSIMIGVITLISVQERTKEIGILRAVGASKRNVSTVFNAETMMIGFAAGLIGVLITSLLCIPINMILRALTDINNLKAALPIGAAVVLVLISVLLTLIAGIIPSRSAAKKEPVDALRTE